MTIVLTNRVNSAMSHPALRGLPTASKRYGRLQTERLALEDEYADLQNALMQARVKYGEAKRRHDYAKASQAPNRDEFAPEVEAARAGQEKLQRKAEALLPRLGRLRAASASCARGLADGRRFAERIVDPAADDLGRLDALRERRTEVEALPPTLETSIANEFRRLDKLAAQGRPKAFLRSQYSARSRNRLVETVYADFRFPKRELDNVAVERPNASQRPEVFDALALLAWIDPDKLKDNARAELESLYEKIVESMDRIPRLREMRRLDAEILDIERGIASAAFEAEELDLPEDASAEAILGIEAVTDEVGNAA